MADGRFPSKDADFNDHLVIIVPYLVANAARLGIAPATVVSLTDLMDLWTANYPLSQNNDTATKTIIDTKIAQRESMETLLRSIYADIPNSRLTTADRNTLKLPAKDTTPTARPAITTSPETTIKASEGRKVIVSCRVSGDSSRASRHKDSDGVEYRYTLATQGGTATTGAPGNPFPSTASVVDFSSKARFTIQLESADAGKVITVECRWKNNTDKSKSGTWSNPVQTMVSW